MDDNQLEAFKHMTIVIGAVILFLAVIIWFVVLGESGLEETRLKHETCMVETTYTGESSSRVIATVTEYCGSKQKAAQ